MPRPALILQETASGQTTYYVYGLDLIASVVGSTPTYYLTDGLGSTSALANGAGTVTGTYTYDVFGPARTHTGASTQWTYTGEQNDPNGLEYLRARYYDPGIGRFLTQDPWPGSVFSPLSLDPYTYVLNNPLRWVDPWGLCNLESAADDCSHLMPGQGRGIGWGDVGDFARDYWHHTPAYLTYRAARHLAGPVMNALTSECSQGLAKVSIGVLAVIGAATGAGAVIEAGGVVTISVASTATSAAAVGTAAGPENIQRAVTFLPGGAIQVATNCVP